MIDETAVDKQALASLRCSLLDLVVYVPLAGLTLLGNSITIRENAKTETMATDGFDLHYNPEWVRKKSRRSNTFDLLHEWLHIFDNHVDRRAGRIHKKWNYACDVRVAHDALALLRKARGAWALEADHVPAFPWAESFTAEQIYDALPKPPKPTTLPKAPDSEDDVKYDEQGVPENYVPDLEEKERSEEETERHVQQFRAALAQAALAVEQATAKTLPELYGNHIAERYVQILRGGIPWHLLLRGSLVDLLGKERASWSPPNFRFTPHLVLPSVKGDKQRELFIAVDISSSITPTLLNRFASNVEAAAQRATKITVVTFDAVVREVINTKSPKAVLKQLKFQSGEHSYTSTVEAFALAESCRPQAIVVLTDGLVALPEAPAPNVFWVVPEQGPTMPWGRTIHMRASW